MQVGKILCTSPGNIGPNAQAMWVESILTDIDVDRGRGHVAVFEWQLASIQDYLKASCAVCHHQMPPM